MIRRREKSCGILESLAAIAPSGLARGGMITRRGKAASSARRNREEREEEEEEEEKEEKGSGDRSTSSEEGVQLGTVLRRSAVANALSQAGARLLPFTVNLLIARTLSPDEYKLPSVHFHLVTTTILLLGREGFRRACLRMDTNSPRISSCNGHSASQGYSENEMIVLNTSWLAIPVSAFVSLLLLVSSLFLSPPSSSSSSYISGVALHCVAGIVEVLSEPLQGLANARLSFRVRVVAESLAAMVGAGTTYACLLLLSHSGASAFGYGRISSALTLLAVYWLDWAAWTRRRAGGGRGREELRASWLPRRLKDGSWFNSGVLDLSRAYWIQAAEKLFLGEGEKMVLAAMASGYDQGVFGLVSSLGSLAVRTVFLPLEEAAFLAFGKTGGIAVGGKEKEKEEEGGGEEEGNQKTQSLVVLQQLLRWTSTISLLFTFFAPPYCFTLLRILYGERWATTEAPRVLSAYCYYVALLALNGVTEAFVHAVGSKADLRNNNMWLLFVTVFSMATSTILIGEMGASGLVLSMCLNMALRITFSLVYIHKYSGSQFQIAKALPSLASFGVAATASPVMRLSNHFFMSNERNRLPFVQSAVAHVGHGLIWFLLFAVSVVYTDESLREMLMLRSKKKKKKAKST